MKNKKRFATVCSGIAAPELAVKDLGWTCAFSSDIEKFPNAVRANHFPDVPNYGDMNNYEEWPYSNIDVLIGGTPCQSFSIAGLGKGLSDSRGNLTIVYGRIAAKYRPRWLLWENVPGVLSNDGGKSFAAFLGLLTGRRIEPPAEGWQSGGWISGISSAYGVAWRVFDAQYFGVAQRRQRVFVVGHIGGQWKRAAAVLFERDCLQGNPAPSRNARKDVAGTLAARTSGGGELGTDFELDGGLVAKSIKSSHGGHRSDPTTDNYIPVGVSGSDVGLALRASGSHSGDKGDGGMNQTLVAESTPDRALKMRGREGKEGGGKGPLLSEEKSLTIATSNDQVLFAPIAFAQNSRDEVREIGNNIAGCLASQPGMKQQTYVAEIAPCRTARDAKGERMDIAEPSLIVETALTIPGNWIGRKPENGGNQTQPGEELSPTLTKTDRHAVVKQLAVRRLTPKECERLQGFEDDFTLIPLSKREIVLKKKFANALGEKPKMAADSPRYKALGNSMAVPNIAWICRRIDLVDELAPLN